MSATSVQKVNSMAERQARYNSRNRVNTVALILAVGAMAFGVFWLIWILIETFRLGLGGMSLALFTQMTPPPNEVGGLANAIWGSLVICLLYTSDAADE